MKPAPFDYVRAESVDEVLSLLDAHGGDARILAGGQSLIAMLNMRLAQPAVLIDVMQIPGGDALGHDRDALRISFGLRQATLLAHPGLRSSHPLVARTLPWIGHPQTRARGTLCGSAAHADPSAELPLLLAALDAEVELRSARRGRRRVRAGDFFIGTMLTDRTETEMITALHLPATAPGTGTAFAEVGRRKGDFAIVAVSAIAHGPRLRLVVGGVDDRPVVRDWDRMEEADLPDALNELAWSLDARDDLHATARYRRELVRRLGRHVTTEARACAA